MITDPIGDLIIRLKNGSDVKKTFVSIPFSLFKMAIAEKLKDAGFVKSVEKKGKKVKKTIDVTLVYDEAGNPKIQGVRRISKPGRRLYRSVQEIVPVRYGHGAIILSTPKGVMTGTEARKAQVGGEALFEIW
jgi:small subunit ribosomal protein S8